MYKIQFSNIAAHALQDIYKSDQKIYARLMANIEFLSKDPFCGKQLKGPLKGNWSLRIGDYRIIYYVLKEKLIVSIIDVGHRKEIYR